MGEKNIWIMPNLTRDAVLVWLYLRDNEAPANLHLLANSLGMSYGELGAALVVLEKFGHIQPLAVDLRQPTA